MFVYVVGSPVMPVGAGLAHTTLQAGNPHPDTRHGSGRRIDLITRLPKDEALFSGALGASAERLEGHYVYGASRSPRLFGYRQCLRGRHGADVFSSHARRAIPTGD